METIQVSRHFGDYLIKRKIGMGGMASVYQAIERSSKQEVALKILHEHFAEDLQIRKRLAAEARIVMALSHPNIVPVWDFGQVGNRPYLVMPYMDGGSLAEYFASPRSVKHETSLHLLAILADALDYAHSQQVIHRDFKLENVLIHQSMPSISDFGIAQSAQTTRITMTGQVLGTPHYLAPESLDDIAIDYHADLYAMAVMAYLMLTGYYPFTGKDALTIAVKLHTEAVPLPSVINPKLPIHLDKILLKGLAKDPQARFASAKDFVDALYRGFSQMEMTDTSTMIYVDALNPFQTTPQTRSQGIKSDLPHLAAELTQDFSKSLETITIPAPKLSQLPAKAKASRRLPLGLLLLAVCGLVGFGGFALNQGIQFLNNPAEISASTAIIEPETFLLVVENTESVTSTSSASPSPSLTLSSSPSSTQSLRPTRTVVASPSQTALVAPSMTSAAIYNTQIRLSSTQRPRPSNTAHPSSTVQASATNTLHPPSPTTMPSPIPTNPPVPTDIPPVPTDVPDPTDAPVPTEPPVDTAVPADTVVPCEVDC